MSTEFEHDAPPPADPVTTFLLMGVGFGLTLGLHLCTGSGLGLVDSAVGGGLWVPWLMTIGLSQFVYVLPVALALFFFRKALALGMILGAAVTFLLQASCYALMLPMMAGLH